jgi:hypothetical protein
MAGVLVRVGVNSGVALGIGVDVGVFTAIGADVGVSTTGVQDEVTRIMASKQMWMRILFFIFIPSQLINYTQVVN